MILNLSDSVQEEGGPSSEMHSLLQSNILSKKAHQIYHGQSQPKAGKTQDKVLG